MRKLIHNYVVFVAISFLYSWFLAKQIEPFVEQGLNVNCCKRCIEIIQKCILQTVCLTRMAELAKGKSVSLDTLQRSVIIEW